MNKILIISVLILISITLIIYCLICEKKILNNEKYHEIIKFENQGEPTNTNYYVLTNNNNDDIIRGNKYPLYKNKRFNKRMKYTNNNTNNNTNTNNVNNNEIIKPYGYMSEIPDMNEYIHNYSYNTGNKVLDGFNIYNKSNHNINISQLQYPDKNELNINDNYMVYDLYPSREANNLYPSQEVSNKMVTSVYPNICSMYGSSNLPNIDFYNSNWCNIGILTNNNGVQPFTVLTLYAQYTGGGIPWKYKVWNKLTDSYIYLSETTKGSGIYSSLRDGDTISNLPGFQGTWTVQIQKETKYIIEETIRN